MYVTRIFLSSLGNLGKVNPETLNPKTRNLKSKYSACEFSSGDCSLTFGPTGDARMQDDGCLGNTLPKKGPTATTVLPKP